MKDDIIEPEFQAFSVPMNCKAGLYNWCGEYWLFKQHKDGQWVSVRKATKDDMFIFGQRAM